VKFNPHKYQQEIVAHIAAHKRSFVIAAAGAGKTAAVLSTIQPGKRTLIIAPLRVARHTWPDEIEKWDFGLTTSMVMGTPAKRRAALAADADVFISNVENVAWIIDQGVTFDRVVVDESSLFKNPTSKRFKALGKHLKGCPDTEVVLMTATPSPNGLLDVWSQMFLLDQGKRLGRSFYGFKQRFFESDFMGYTWTPREASVPKIRAAISEVATVVENYAGLPQIVQLNEFVDIPNKAMEAYNAMRRDFLVEVNDAELSAANAAVMVGKLAQISAGACYDDDGDVVDYHDAKIKALREIVETTDENILVAYTWRHDKERVLEVFPDAIDIKDPGAVDAWNAGDVPLLLAHPRSAGHGLNLQGGGRRIVWLNPTWSNELKIQFDARLFRQGQKDTVFVHTILAAETIDEEIMEVVGTKKTMQDLLIAAVKKKRLVKC